MINDIVIRNFQVENHSKGMMFILTKKWEGRSLENVSTYLVTKDSEEGCI